MGTMQPQDPWFEKIYSAFLEEKIFIDLRIIIVWLLLTGAVIYLPVISSTPVRNFIALPMILFIPGYSLVSSLFPDNESVSMAERLALSIGLSVVMVPMIGLGLNYTPWGVRLDPIVISLMLLTAVMVAISQYRRAILPQAQRHRIIVDGVITGIKEGFLSKDGSRIDRVLSFFLIIAILSTICTTIFVIAIPKEGEKFSEFFILGEGKKAAAYPATLLSGTQYPMYIGVGNHEYKKIIYTIETHLVNISFDEKSNTSIINDMNRIDVMPVILAHNETIILPYNLTPRQTGYNQIEFLLFNETIPLMNVTGLERINASYRNLHLRVNIHSEN
jgi:uncharacterized membrane protein